MDPDLQLLGGHDIDDTNLDFRASYANFFESTDDDDFIENPYISDNLSCNYYTEDSFLGSYRNLASPLVLNLNVQYLQSKFNSLKELLDLYSSKGVNFDIISLQEISTIDDSSTLILPGFHPLVYKSRTLCKGGGVGFYVRNDLDFKVIEEYSPFHERIIETVCIEVVFNKSKLYFISVYRPPGNHPSLSNKELFASFMESFSNLLGSVDTKDCYILTDSNVNLLSLSNSSQSLDFLDLLLSYGFLNLITKATRFSKNSFSLIDQIFTNKKSLSFSSGIILNDLSDHLLTFTCLDFKKGCKPAPKFKKCRDFSDRNLNQFKDNLSSLSWERVTSCQDVNLAFSNFWEDWSLLFDLHFPLKSVRFNKNYHKINDFMTKGILISRKNKLNLYQKFLFSQNSVNENRYKTYRNLYNKIVKAAKVLYFEKKLESNKSDPKKMWGTLNEAINRSSSKSTIINEINVKGVTVTDSGNIANEFNTFFSEIADNILKDIPVTSARPEDYITDSGLNFELGLVTTDEIIEIIKSLKTKGSLDIDGLNTKLLKKVINEIAVPLSHIFSISFKLGVFPDRLKISRTCPVFKSDKRNEMNNYRPISCLPVLSKLIEKLAHKRLFSFVSSNNLLYTHQYGFQPNKSTVHPLLNIVNYITSALNNNEIAVGVFLDFKKAFDVVNHDILLLKLNKMGIKNANLQWFRSYLKDRKQYVMVNNIISDLLKEFNVSVPQGSILGPLLFLIFINDMHKSNDLLNFHFADDSTGLAKGPDLFSVGNFINNELQKLGMWLRANKISINTSKTKIMVFHLKQKPVPYFNFVFNNNDINAYQNPSLVSSIERITNESEIPAYKMLGVFLDENLTFNYHVKQTRNKISKALFFLTKAKNLLSSKALKSLYFALVHPHFLYCLPIYSSTSKKNMDSLYVKQKKCMRVIYNAKYNAHTQPIFYSLGILPLPDLVTLQNLLIMHSIDKDYSRVTFEGFYEKNAAVVNHDYPLRNAGDFIVPRIRLEFLKSFPFFSLPKTWNSLEPGFRNVSIKSLFKYNVKSHLLSKYCEFSCNRLYCYVCSKS